MPKNDLLPRGRGLYATFPNIDTPATSTFQNYLSNGLRRFSVFVFVPGTESLPTTADWYTTEDGGQPQGLNTNGGSTVQSWQQFFSELNQQGVEVGFVFGGEGGTENLGTMLKGLNADAQSFSAFVEVLRSYHVSYIEFDIEGSWDTPPDFATEFQAFAQNLTTQSSNQISTVIGASAPVGTVNGLASNIPSYLDHDFAAAHNVYFNVYTYYTLEIDNVLNDPSPWLPSDTLISPSQIGFAVTANATTPAPPGQVTFTEFMQDFPNSTFRNTVEENYSGMTVWVWWHGATKYPSSNVFELFQAIPGS
ncbi:MAG: hypothetical protein AAGD01_14060 [Acidobacteriota bacterium]